MDKRKENVRTKDKDVEKAMDTQRGKRRGVEQEKTFQGEYNQPLSPLAAREPVEFRRGNEQKSSFVFPHLKSSATENKSCCPLFLTHTLSYSTA